MFADGTYSSIRIVRGSGVQALDNAALEAVQAVGRFRSIPAEIKRDPWSFEIRLVYALQ